MSWRRADFKFVGADQRMVAKGVSDESGRYPFDDRYAIRVTLRDRDTHELISMLNTHLPQAIENLDKPGHWRPTYNSARARLQLTRMARMWDRAPGRWVVGTGDYNVDAGAEEKQPARTAGCRRCSPAGPCRRTRSSARTSPTPTR